MCQCPRESTRGHHVHMLHTWHTTSCKQPATKKYKMLFRQLIRMFSDTARLLQPVRVIRNIVSTCWHGSCLQGKERHLIEKMWPLLRVNNEYFHSILYLKLTTKKKFQGGNSWFIILRWFQDHSCKKMLLQLYLY